MSGKENGTVPLLQDGIQILAACYNAALVELFGVVRIERQKIDDRPRKIVKDGIRTAGILAEEREVLSDVAADLFSEKEEKECDDSCQSLGYRPRKMSQAVGGEDI